MLCDSRSSRPFGATTPGVRFWRCWMFTRSSSTSTGRSAHTSTSRCIAGTAASVSSNIASIDCSLTTRSMHVGEFSPTGLDFHPAAFVNVTTFHLITASRREVLEDRKSSCNPTTTTRTTCFRFLKMTTFSIQNNLKIELRGMFHKSCRGWLKNLWWQSLTAETIND